MILHTQKDIAEEDKIAGILQQQWNCSFKRYPQMFTIDWYISQKDVLIAFAELKRRYINHDTYKTVYLSFAKWSHILSMSVSGGCRGFIIYGFNDGIWYQDAQNIDPRGAKILGRTDREDVITDLEPMIEIPIEDLRNVKVNKQVYDMTSEEWLDGYAKA